MKLIIIEKIKKLLYVIFNFLKSILIAFFCFFFNLFNSSTINFKDSSNINSKVKKKDKQIKQADVSAFHDEEPRKMNYDNNITIIYSEEKIKKLIKFYFLQELELNEDELDETLNDYLDSLNKKIIQKVKDNNNDFKTSKTYVFLEKIHDVLLDELEEQIKLEENNETNIVLSPFIFDRKPQSLKNNNSGTFLNKVLRKKESCYSEILPHMPKVIVDQDKKTTLSDIHDDSMFIVSPDIPVNDLSSNSSEDLSFSSFEENHSNATLEKSNFVADIEELFDEAPLKNPLNAEITSNNSKSKSMNNEVPKNTDSIREEIILHNNLPCADFEHYNSRQLDSLIQVLTNNIQQEINKEELDDKNYDVLENLIQDLLAKINRIKKMNLQPSQLNEIKMREKQVIQLRDSLELQKEKDVNNEVNLLEENISLNELKALEKELENFYIEDNMDLQNNFLKRLEDLKLLPNKKAGVLEKELLKAKLRKTLRVISIFSFPFTRNKYFCYFVSNLLANRSLKMFYAVLKRETLEYEPPEISHIKNGANALDDALFFSDQNIDFLNYLEVESLRKYPELVLDKQYMSYLKKIKIKFLKKKEKMLKKERAFKKYNIVTPKKVRKLKKISPIINIK